MRAEVRALLGKAAYEEAMRGDAGVVDWRSLSPGSQATYERMAEAVVKALAGVIVPPLVTSLLSEQDVEQLLVMIQAR